MLVNCIHGKMNFNFSENIDVGEYNNLVDSLG